MASSSLQLRRGGAPSSSEEGASATPAKNIRRSAAPRRVGINNKKILSRPFRVVVGVGMLLVAVWIVCAFYMTGYFSYTQEHSLLLQRDSQKKAPPGGSPQNTKEDEVIDMRELNFQLPFANPDGGAWKQGWEVEPKEGPIKIFVLPHSHCDPGWIKTFDQYFQQQTKNILNSVITALSRNPQRKFIWAEISYFEWWWREQTEDVRDTTRRLLKSGQLEFVTGGWVQTDEANSQLYAMEIQLQEGHDWIRKTFGEEYIPRYGWSIDPFGYSPTMAYLLKKYNFQGMLIQRVHYAIKKELAKRKHLEFMWRQTWDPTGKHDIFTHVMPFYSYDVPHTCGPDPSVCCQFDFGRSPIGTYGACPWRKNPEQIHDSNVKERAMLLLDQYRKKSALYRSNVVIAPLGDDFRYMTVDEAENQYVNYQKIFDYLNAHVPGVQAQFGTLSDYFKAVQGTFAPPILKGSFFTYSDREQDYWSGYYTSRVFDKALDRKLERVLFAASAMGTTNEALQESRRALSLFQHHDGVTGTAQDHVVLDYAKRMHTAITDTQKMMIEEIIHNAPVDQISDGKLQPCWMSDAPRGLSQNLCREDQSIVVYNPLKTPQTCGRVVAPGRAISIARLPCEKPGPRDGVGSTFKFDSRTGLMTHPVREEWMVWKVHEGGAYLFFPGELERYEAEQNVVIEEGGFVVSTPNWKRTIVQPFVPHEFPSSSLVLDFIFETNLQASNQEWFVRFTGDVTNQGVFHTDLNGFNFDTHRFRKDMPIQSQVYPMPTLASIEDLRTRMTVLSEHAQGTASLRDGSIDIWLDRRLAQDDNRGLGQGVKDNVPTRTKLRLLVETEGYETKGEFRISPLSRRMWDELNHPLELFGYHAQPTADENAAAKNGASARHRRAQSNSSTSAVPFVYMVYKRLDYFKRSIDSLRQSDFPKSEVPLIISHDGHVKEMTDFVETLKEEFRIVQLFHPFACSEHPDSFPGDDPKLNVGYRGDTFGNKRTGSVTCAKHHFTWMMQTLLENFSEYDAFFFMEEDYVVAPTIYSSIKSGFSLIRTHPSGQSFFGLALDTTDGHTKHVRSAYEDSWLVNHFITGPMALSRDVMEQIRQRAQEYCTFDEYNWDWSIVHLQLKTGLPYVVLYPSKPQALHIGAEGMHGKNVRGYKLSKIQQTTVPPPFNGGSAQTIANEHVLNVLKAKKHDRGYGGWGHPADQNHCLQLFQPGSVVNIPFIKIESISISSGLLAKLNPFRWFQQSY